MHDNNNMNKNIIAKDHREKRMKIRCDVCDRAEATVFCSADEAALCETCDRHVHHANKLAGKHLRFSLLHPSSKQSPLCDICQERRAFLFCQEDRAILCRECDITIHKANELTKKHSRFLLTGVKLSTTSFYPSSPSNSSSNSCCNTNNNSTSSKKTSAQHLPNHSNYHHGNLISSPSIERATPSSTLYNNYNNIVDDSHISSTDNISISTSSISEYLETLPGWRVDDFLDPSISADSYNKTFDNFSSLSDHQDLELVHMGSFFPEDFNFWVPQLQVSSVHQSSPHVYLLDGFLLNESKLGGKIGKLLTGNGVLMIVLLQFLK